ncbi:MAG: hypothetical protein JWP07_4536, partial [Pseudonocardiales bacterium]|jgi:hypothetical protein|nr:hypothetical protein [Pseudonocardiales bacterium]
LVQTRNSPLGVLIGTIRDPPETTSRGSQVEVLKYESGGWLMTANYRHISRTSWISSPLGRRHGSTRKGGRSGFGD